MSTNPTDRIAERRRFIAQRTAELKAELDTLTAEGDELDIADRVYKRFSEPPSIGGEARHISRTPAPNWHEEDEPASVPTLPQMVFAILEEAKAAGRKGATGSEILAIVQARWKPAFTAENVRPSLWRMVKAGRLRKRGSVYSTPVTTSSPEGETEAVGASARQSTH